MASVAKAAFAREEMASVTVGLGAEEREKSEGRVWGESYPASPGEVLVLLEQAAGG